jgi:hypothetical protein
MNIPEDEWIESEIPSQDVEIHQRRCLVCLKSDAAAGMYPRLIENWCISV